MAVAKPKEGAGLYAKGVLGKIFKERTGEEVGVVKRKLLSEVAMGFIPGAGAVAKPARMLKPHAVGKTIIGGSRRAMGGRTWPWVQEMLKAPAKEFGRVRDISVRYPSPGRASYGTYRWPGKGAKGEIDLFKQPRIQATTPVHELAHARVMMPEAGEEAGKRAIQDFYLYLQERGIDLGRKNPFERHASVVAEVVRRHKGPISAKKYGKVHRRTLQRAIGRAEEFVKIVEPNLDIMTDESLDHILRGLGID